ncbi:hypothetical protein RB195_012765 [Necator americanus]
MKLKEKPLKRQDAGSGFHYENIRTTHDYPNPCRAGELSLSCNSSAYSSPLRAPPPPPAILRWKEVQESWGGCNRNAQHLQDLFLDLLDEVNQQVPRALELIRERV